MSERGWDFWLMSLAHELKMTRRQLLRNIDSREIELWKAYFFEMNSKQRSKTTVQPPKVVEQNIQTALAVFGRKGKKRGRHA